MCDLRPVLPPDLSALLADRAAVYGERSAVLTERINLTFAALDRDADAWSATLQAAGCGAGTHVGLLAANSPEWLAAAFGVWRAAATLVPISTFVTVRELAEILAHADVEVLIVQPRLRSHDYLHMIEQMPRLPRLRKVIVLDTQAAADGAQGSMRSAIDPNAVACMLYTSGTTGTPKGVMLSHRAALATVLPTAHRSGLTAADTLLSTLPLFWVAGLLIRALPTLAAGCTLILMETFTADALVAALDRHRPTALHLRPPQVGQVLAHPRFRPELLAQVRKGGGRAEWYAPHLTGARFITGYGMTETAGYVTALDWHDPATAAQTPLGTPLPGMELRIVDDTGRPCGAGDVGAVCVRGPGLFSGYYKRPAGSGLDDAGFFMTGDLGNLDAAGTFHFVGRSKDLLRVKGINVSPVEVEGVLAAHPGVEAAYVVGIPPDGLEQQVVALIVAKPGASPAAVTLQAHAALALSHYKRPQKYLFIERHDVALSATSKPQRSMLVELATRHIAKQRRG